MDCFRVASKFQYYYFFSVSVCVPNINVFATSAVFLHRIQKF
jgi:hypothetical protein